MKSENQDGADVVRCIKEIARMLYDFLGETVWNDPANEKMAEKFQRIQLMAADTPVQLRPESKPVVRYWEEVLSVASNGRLGPLVDLVREITPYL